MGNIIQKFLEELSDALSTERKLTSCDREMQIYTDIQKERLMKKGLVLDYDFTGRGLNPEGREQGWEARDEHYFAKMWSSSNLYKRILKKNGKVINKKKQNVSVWALVINYINGQNMEDEVYVCPNCGNPEKIKALTEGCPYCGTSFKMDELYPKVTGYNLVYDPSKDKKEMIKFYIITSAIAAVAMLIGLPVIITGAAVLLGIVLAVLKVISFETAGQLMLGGISLAVQSICAAPFVGLIFSSGILVAKLLIEGAKSAPLLATFSTHKMFEEELKKYGVDFMPQYFMGQTVAKVKSAIFSENPEELPFYEGGQLPEEMKDIVDIFFRGAIEFKSVEVKDDVAYVNANIYTEVLSEKNGKAKENQRIFNINMKKNLSKKNSLDFAISKFMCPSCGTSFNAYKHKKCPACDNAYKMEDADWVIESIS